MIELPKKVLIPKRILKEKDINNIVDYLSDEYGFCVNTFDIKIYNKRIYAENINWDITK